jgi:hypothetical protein
MRQEWQQLDNRVFEESAMTEEEYFTGEFSDDYLNTQVDAGEYHLDEEGMLDLPTDE